MKNYIFKKWVAPKVRSLWHRLVDSDKEFFDAVKSAPRDVKRTFTFFMWLGVGLMLWTEYQARQGRLILGIEDEVIVSDIFGF